MQLLVFSSMPAISQAPDSQLANDKLHLSLQGLYSGPACIAQLNFSDIAVGKEDFFFFFKAEINQSNNTHHRF